MKDKKGKTKTAIQFKTVLNRQKEKRLSQSGEKLPDPRSKKRSEDLDVPRGGGRSRKHHREEGKKKKRGLSSKGTYGKNEWETGGREIGSYSLQKGASGKRPE